ncbi:hypothetical protein GCM10027447_23830 [Glycomyces halotolerans]
MRTLIKAVYNRLGRPPLRRLAAVCGLVAAGTLVAVALFGDQRLVSSLSLLMSLLTLAGVALAWYEARRARRDTLASNERAEVTFRRILAAIEVERLAAERRKASGIVPVQEHNRLEPAILPTRLGRHRPVGGER